MAKSGAAKPKGKAKRPREVFLATAAFCEQVMEDKPAEGKLSGLMSLIRIFDTLEVELPQTPPDDGIPGFVVKGLITLRTNAGPFTSAVRLVMVAPNGKKKESNYEAPFVGKGMSAHNLTLTLGVVFEGAGDYRLEVWVDGRRLTVMPLRIALRSGASAPPAKKGR